MDKDKIWEKFVEQINLKVSSVTYNTWFRDLRLLTINEKDIVIIAPHSVHKNHIINNYMDLVEEIFLELVDGVHNIIFCLEGEYNLAVPKQVMNSPGKYTDYVASDKEINEFVEKHKTNLKEKYTFDNFVVGDSNRFAYSSCMTVAQNPGKLYNPLFLYGKSGLGKTHLMHAMGNYIHNNSDLKVLYVTTDEFMNEFISITKDSGNKEENLEYIDLFKSKYRDVDVLMIDDIQFMGTATVTQQEFTNTFNTLHSHEKQIIICSDRSVDDLKMFEERLKTRFNWGLKAIIGIPDYDLKVKIIKNKIKSGELMMNLNDDIIGFIASNCGSDVRNLEGAIIRLYAYQATWGLKELTLENATEALGEYTNNMLYSDNSVHKIMSVVANYFNLTVDALKGKKRSKEIANARQIAMYLCRLLTDETYPRIGSEFGGRDHSTVIFAFDKISENVKNDAELEKIISDLKIKLSE